jgi:hypothetical protein
MTSRDMVGGALTRSITRVVAGLVLALGLATTTAAPALANSTKSDYCHDIYKWNVVGTSTTSYARTTGPGGGKCGSPGVKSYWQYYPGGITYNSGWIWNCYTCTSSTYYHSSNVGGGHDVGLKPFGVFPFYT